jgi:hypothetical protein
MERIDILKRQLASISTECALIWLIQKNASCKCFFWDGKMWTPSEAKDEWETCLLKMPCSKFGVVRFYGGPPGKGRWFNGTVLSMVCDLILFDENTENLSVSEKLSK